MEQRNVNYGDDGAARSVGLHSGILSLIELSLPSRGEFKWLPLASGLREIRKAKWTEIAFTAVQYVSGNELVSLDHLSSSS